MKTPKVMRILVLITLFLAFNQISKSANVSWLSAVSGNWNDGTKWSGGSAPTVNDTAVITVAGTYTVTLNVNASIAKVVLGNASGFQTLFSGTQTLTLANASTINPHGILYLNSGNTVNGAGTLTNNGKIVLNYNNIVSCTVNNTDTIFVDHQSNSVTGTFTTTASSVLYLRCQNSVAQLTYSNGWVNNGKIIMASVNCYYTQLSVTAGVLTNPVGSIIQSSPLPNCYGYNRIDAAVNNQGTINVDYTLNIYTSTGASTNTGTVNFTSSGMTLNYYSGIVNWNSATLNFNSTTGCTLGFNASSTLNWNGGTTAGTGRFYFDASVGNFNTASLPAQEMYFNSSSTLGSSAPTITNSKKITLNYNNIVSANLNNTDTIFVDHQSNSVTGAFTTTASSVLYLRCQNSVAQLTYSNGWINNGKIIMASVNCYYTQLSVTAGVLTNPVGSVIQSSPLPNCYGYNRIDAAVNNQGTINIDYTLNIYTSAGASTNTGTVNFTSSGMTLNYYNGTVNWNSAALNFNSTSGCTIAFNGSSTLNWNGGTTTGTGRFYFDASVGNFNTASLPAQEMYFNTSSTLGSSAPTITNSKKITLNYNNIVSANLNNTDTIFVDHQSNSVTGTFTTTASSVLYLRCQNSVAQLTYSNGWVNNGKIIMASVNCYYTQLSVTAGVLTNPVGSIIQSSPLPNCYGYNRIDAAVNNQGTMNIAYTLNIYTSAGASTNTGTVNFTSPNYVLAYYNGTINWNGATINFNTGCSLNLNSATLNWNSGAITGGTGQFNFESSTGNFTTAATPNVRMYFNSSTLASPMLPLTSSHLMEFNYNNTISAAVFNTDTIKIHHQSNTMSGALTTSPASVILLDGLNSHSTFTVNAGFTNNGLIRFYNTANSCYYGYLAVSTGTLINAPGGIIQSDPNPSCIGYHRMDAALNNLGTINVNYTFRHYTSAGASHNTGNINFSNGYNLEVYNGTWNWDGGIATSPTSQINFYSATASFNTSTMPSVVTYFSSSTLASTLGGISNAKKIRLSGSNTVSANLNNTDTLMVHSNPNSFTGTFTNNASSKLLFDGLESHSYLTFSNGFTNNGTIRFYNTANGCYYGYMLVTAGVLTNAATGIIQSDPNPTCILYHRMDAALNNLGTINVNYTFRHYTSAGASHNTGNINFSNGYNLEVYNGTWNWDGGIATSPTSQINFYSATASFNTSTMPSVVTYFSSSTLASTLGGISNAKKIRLSGSNTVSANLNNTDTLMVHSNPNSFTGTFTNNASSKLLFDGLESHSYLTFSNGFTNNGTIRFYNTANGCYYGYMLVTAGVLTNAATGIIQSDPNPTCILYHRMDAALNNLGTINVNYTLRHYTSAGASHNTGNINFTNGYNLEVYNGTWHWDGGIATSPTSQINFYSATASFNTATMPSIITYFSSSALASTLGGISNAKKIRLSGSNTVSANLNNTDTLMVHSNPNSFTGTFTNTASSKLLFDGLESHSYLTFSNGFTNNGTIRFYNTANGCYYGYMLVTAGTLTNASGATIISDPNPTCIGYQRLDGNILNNGIVTINYPFNHSSGNFVNNGTIKGGSYLNNSGALLTNNGTIAPGTSPGKLSINANLSNKSTSIWNIEVGGLTVATQFDQVDNNYTSTKDSIDGTLNISLINGFVPSLGDSVIIETHNLRTGTFATITGQAIPGGLFWNVFYRTNHIALRAGNPPNLTITSSTGTNGTISPLGSSSVVYNGTQTYNMLPNTNYHVLDVLVDGVSVGAVTSYTFNSVIVNHTISVTFAINTWNIVATTSGNGAISPNGTVVVNQGNNQTFNITANPCNLIDSVIVDGGYVGTNNSYTFTNVVANHTIKAVFRIAPRIIASGATTFCTGGSVTLNAGTGYINYNWSTGANSQSINVTASGTYACTITSTGGCTSSTAVVVTVNPLPAVSFTNPYAASSGHVCVTNGGIALNGFGSPAGGGFSGSGVSNSFGNYGFTPSGAGVGTHTLAYNYTDGNGCSNSATTNVIVDQDATVNAGADIILCNNPLANLSGVIGGSASSASWGSNGTGNFGNANLLSTTYTLSSADMTAGTVTLTLLTNDPANTCGAISDQLVIIYNPDAIADAGPAVACVTSPVAVSGSISGYPATPQWTTTGTGNFSNANSLNSVYNPSVADLTAGHVYLILTPIDPLGNCTFTADSMDAWFNPNYSVSAGSDVILCGINDTIATLNGSFVNATSVTWIGNGSGVFANANNANTTYVLSASDRANGSLVLTLTTNDPAGPCTAVSDFMIVKYKYAIADAGVDMCGDTITSIGGSANANILATSSLNYLWTTTGTGSFGSANNPSTTYHASNTDLTSGQTKIYFNLVDGTGECTYAKDSAVIWYNPHYSASTGADTMEFCANTVLNIAGSSLNALSTTWTTSGTGTFGNANLLSTTYTPSNADTTAGFVTLTLTSNDPNGPCGTVSDNMYIIIHSAPDASAGNNTPICNGIDLNLTASGGTSYSWTGPNGFTSSQQNIVVPNSTVAMSGTYNVTVNNNFGCSNPASTVVVVNPCGCVAPSLLQSHIDVTCFGGSNGSIDITAVGGSGGNTFLWSNNETTEDVSGLSAGTYIITVTVAGGCTVTMSVTLTQPASPLPPITILPNGATTFCIGGSVVLDAGVGYGSYSWSNGLTLQAITITASGSYTVTATNGSGCTAASITPVAVTVETAPPSGSIHSPLNTPLYACTGDVLVSSCNTVPGASVYTWDAPNGTTFDGTIDNPYNTTNTVVNVHYGQPNGTGYYICVQASNSCGSTNRKCGWVRGTVSGPDPIVAVNNRFVECQNTSASYSINPIGGATSYTWTITGNATVTNNGTSVTVNFLSGWSGGTLCVNGNTPCTSGPTRCVQLSTATAAPGVLSGPSTVCPNSNATYSIPVASGAVAYNWLLPSNTSGSSSTNSINIHFNSNYALGNVRVNITSICGVVSSTMVKTVSVGLPPSPAAINSANGAYGLCNQTAVFSCNSVSGATSYTWTPPSGAIINSGQGTTSTNISFGNFTNGNVCVTADNSCGSSAPRCISVNGKPGAPASIIVNPSTICANQSGVELNVLPVYGTIGYSWSFPAGVSSVLDNGNQQIVNWGPSGGTVMVTVANACGNSTRSQNISLSCRQAGEEESNSIEIDKISVYPNPAHDKVNMSYYEKEKSAYILTIHDLSGREIIQRQGESNEGKNDIQIDLSGLAKGAYVLQLNTSSVNKKVRVILE